MHKVNNTLWELREQYLAEQNIEISNAIKAEYERVIDAIFRIAGIQLEENAEGYAKATKSLGTANAALRKARRKLEGIATAIERVASVVDTIVEIADTVT